MHVMIDLAADRHGNNAGRDNGHTLDRFSFSLADYTAIRNEMLTRLARGDSDQMLIDWLTPIAAAPVRMEDGPTKLVGLGAQSGNFAHLWLAQIRAGQRDTIAAQLKIQTPETRFPIYQLLATGKRGGLQ
jgi:hypothetical protein